MKFEGKIKNFNKIVVSDPHYLQNVWCRYEKNFDKSEDWKVIFLIKEVDEMEEEDGLEFNIKGLDFSILIKREKSTSNLLDIGKYTHFEGMKMNNTEIGIDTAQVCMGINEKATEINEFAKRINNNKNVSSTLYNPPFAIQTACDGKLGTVTEGTTKKDETDFILITGFFDEFADVNTVDELKDYIVQQLKIEDLELCKDAFEVKHNDIDYNI
ncbi:MAG: hypothetical protein HFJ38_04310 [Bacilli bacterium]|nr:hypothetical protein [Bacilli bacterium]